MSSTVLVVKNFARYQHYRDRNPPWIKLYTALLADVTFMSLLEVSRYHLMACWIVASRSDGVLPDDARVLSRLIGADTPVNVEELVSSGFLKRQQADSKPLAIGKQEASEVLRTEVRGQSNDILNGRAPASDVWLNRFTEADRGTVAGFLCDLPDHQAFAWSSRLRGYLDGLDMPAGKAATPAAIATTIRDLEGSELSPAKFRRYVERAINDAANPITPRLPALPSAKAGVSAKLSPEAKKLEADRASR